MKGTRRVLVAILFVAVTVSAAQSPEPPLADSRLTVHTLLREDIFAGFMMDDLERFSRGEKNIQLLLEKRPAEKAPLLAWSGGANLYRAVRAYESNNKDEFQRYYKRALDLFAEARQVGSTDGGVYAVTGGSFVVFGDRLPKEYQAAAWSTAYECYQVLWKQQAPIVDKLPLHLRGEVLGGLAQAAQRSGHTQELNGYLDKMEEVLHDTPYGRIATQWKSKPATAASSTITCLTCHDGGRLASRLAVLNSK